MELFAFIITVLTRGYKTILLQELYVFQFSKNQKSYFYQIYCLLKSYFIGRDHSTGLVMMTL